MIVIAQVADLTHENFKSSQVMRWWLSRLSSRFGAKSSRERKPKWLPGLHMSFRLVPNSVTLDDLERRNSPDRRVISPNSVAFGADYVEVIEDTPVLTAAEK